jgi:hypothetical protein
MPLKWQKMRRQAQNISRLYNDAMEKILANADEKFIVEPPKDNQNGELWISLNRDTTLGNRNKQQQTQNPQN